MQSEYAFKWRSVLWNYLILIITQQTPEIIDLATPLMEWNAAMEQCCKTGHPFGQLLHE